MVYKCKTIIVIRTPSEHPVGNLRICSISLPKCSQDVARCLCPSCSTVHILPKLPVAISALGQILQMHRINPRDAVEKQMCLVFSKNLYAKVYFHKFLQNNKVG